MKINFNSLKTLFKKKDLDNDGKIESYRAEVQGLFSQFTKMKDSLVQANNQLQDVVEDEYTKQKLEQEMLEKTIARANEKLKHSESLVQRANDEIKMNEKLHDKVSEFIV